MCDKAVETNWCVITGAPCSGKTSVINGLAERGHRVVHEVARALINRQLSAGYSLSEIKTDILAFERRILLEKDRIEKKLPPQQIVFLDRAIPDSIAYYQIENLDMEEPLRYSQFLRYSKVFLFERLIFQSDPVRSENQALAARIEILIAEAYIKLGYEIIRVPLLPVNARIEYVLARSLPR